MNIMEISDLPLNKTKLINYEMKNKQIVHQVGESGRPSKTARWERQSASYNIWKTENNS